VITCLVHTSGRATVCYTAANSVTLTWGTKSTVVEYSADREKRTFYMKW